MVAALLALSASATFGLGDFLGGIGSRRFGVVSIIAFSYPIGFLGVLVWAVASGDGLPAAGGLFAAAAAGVAGVVGLAALYRGFAIGAMGIVAPISAIGPVVPLTVDLARGNTPSEVQLVGIAVAIAGVALASREPVAGRARVTAGAGLAVLAAVCFGSYFVGIEPAASESVPWTIATARGTATMLVVAFIVSTHTPGRLPWTALPLAMTIGLVDTAANLFIAAATTKGLLSVVAVLSSLYPVVTVALAFAFLHERIARVQWLGAAGALTGAALVAAG